MHLNWKQYNYLNKLQITLLVLFGTMMITLYGINRNRASDIGRS